MSKTVLLTPKQVSERLLIRESTLAKWRVTGAHDLPYAKMGSRVVYIEDEVERFISQRRVKSTSQAA